MTAGSGDVLTDEERSDLKVRDLIKQRKLTVRPILGIETVDRLIPRSWRRPAGSSPRIWATLGLDDPFRIAGETSDPTRKPLYVAGRFVRLGKEKRKELPKLPRVPRQQPKQAAKRPTPTPKPRPAPKTAKPAPPLPQRPDMAAAPGQAPPRPSLPKPTKKGRTSRSGRFSARPIRRTEGRTAPPKPAPRPAPPQPPPAAPPLPPKPTATSSPTRPKLQRTATTSKTTVRPNPKPPATPPQAAEPTPKPPPPKKPTPRPPPKGGGMSMGLDDLFGGGAMEGRVRIGRRTKKKAEPSED